MELFKIDQQLTQSLLSALQEKECNLSPDDLAAVIEQIKEGVLSHYVHLLISQIENILDISPNLSEREILQRVAKSVVEYLGAEADIRSIPGAFDGFRLLPRLGDGSRRPSLWRIHRREVIGSHQCYAVPISARGEIQRGQETKDGEQGSTPCWPFPSR
jgi:hypothetical protein